MHSSSNHTELVTSKHYSRHTTFHLYYKYKEASRRKTKNTINSLLSIAKHPLQHHGNIISSSLSLISSIASFSYLFWFPSPSIRLYRSVPIPSVDITFLCNCFLFAYCFLTFLRFGELLSMRRLDSWLSHIIESHIICNFDSKNISALEISLQVLFPFQPLYLRIGDITTSFSSYPTLLSSNRTLSSIRR